MGSGEATLPRGRRAAPSKRGARAMWVAGAARTQASATYVRGGKWQRWGPCPMVCRGCMGAPADASLLHWPWLGYVNAPAATRMYTAYRGKPRPFMRTHNNPAIHHSPSCRLLGPSRCGAHRSAQCGEVSFVQPRPRRRRLPLRLVLAGALPPADCDRRRRSAVRQHVALTGRRGHIVSRARRRVARLQRLKHWPGELLRAAALRERRCRLRLPG
jgi:hypothetical protein